MSKYSERTDRDDCYICSRGNPDILETHHLVPRRHDGGDTAANLVELCPTCHEALERLYGNWFWATVGAVSEERQLNVILDDIIERLGGMHLELLLGLEDLKDDLEDDYRVSIDQAKETAIQNTSEEEESSDNRSRQEILKDVVERLDDAHPDAPGAPKESIIQTADDSGLSREKVECELQKLVDKGELLHTDQNHVVVFK